MRVYICRRDREQALAVRNVLSKSGRHRILDCIESKNADLDRMRASKADVFVLDCAMPYFDGVVLAKALRPANCILISPIEMTQLDSGAVKWIQNLEELEDVLEHMGQQEVSQDMKQAILQELLYMGFKPHTMGTRQLCAALGIVIRDESVLSDVRGRIYRTVAQKMNCTAACVERNIRYAIECAWINGDLNVLQERFGYTIEAERGKPTNRAFLAQIAEHIRLTYA